MEYEMPDIDQPSTNDYSSTWFEVFLEPIQPIQTEAEIAFMTRYLPMPPYVKVLDLCCGLGRHTRALANKHYQVTGIDSNLSVLNKAKKISNGTIEYLEHDMRKLDELPKTFDAIVNLWQSFGYFDEIVNNNILKQISSKLNSKGRLILDVYHRNFFEQHQGSRQFEKNGLTITETKVMKGNRLTVDLNYGDLGADCFEWQLYTPEEMTELARQVGLAPLIICTGFDENLSASADSPRMQLVFEKDN